MAGVSDFIYHLERFVFEYIIFIIMSLSMLLVLYNFPYGCEKFKFININVTLMILIIGGLYATTHPMLFGSIFQMTIT